MCRMMATEWIREHVAYPLNPSIEIPKYPERDIVQYLARWNIRPQELFTQQDTISLARLAAADLIDINDETTSAKPPPRQ